MKTSTLILLTLLATSAWAGDKDKCKNDGAANGSWSNGTCTCPSGYELYNKSCQCSNPFCT